MSKVPKILKLNNGYTIPALGLGTWKSKPGEVKQAVKDAIDVGYRHIDCAYLYMNEKEVGAGLRDKIQEGVVKREDMFITSKLWCTFHRPDLVEGAIKTTLQDLGLEYLDLYLVHWPQAFKDGADDPFPKDANGKFLYSDVDYLDTWRAMETLVEKGLTRSIGVSNFNKKQMDRLLEFAKIKPAVNQAKTAGAIWLKGMEIEVHPYLNQNKMIEFCRSKGIVVTAYCPLGSFDRPWAKPGDTQLIDDPRLKVIAEKYKKSVGQLLIRYAIDRGLTVVPKSVNKGRIAENYDIFDFQLSQEDIAEVAALECNGRICVMGDDDHKYYPFHDEY